MIIKNISNNSNNNTSMTNLTSRNQNSYLATYEKSEENFNDFEKSSIAPKSNQRAQILEEADKNQASKLIQRIEQRRMKSIDGSSFLTRTSRSFIK